MRGQARFGWTLLAMAAMALVLRLVHAWFVTRALGTAQIHDAAYYQDVAHALLGKPSSPTLTTDVPFANVGYPYVLSWIFALVPSANAVLVFQAIVGAATAALTGLVARDVFASERAGLFAATLCSVYSPGIFYDGLLLTPSSSAFASAVLLWAAHRAISNRSWRWAAVAGVAVGVSTLLRASQSLLLVGLSIGICASNARTAANLEPSHKSGSCSKSCLLVALWLGAGACIAPFALPQLESGHWTPLTANGGSNFWIGNHRAASGTYTAAPFLGTSNGGDFQHTLTIERDKFLSEARRRADRAELTLVGADAFWWKEGLREIAAAPVAWLQLVGQKLAFSFNSYEPRTNASVDFFENVSPILRFNPLRFGALAALAVFGALHLGGSRREAAAAVLAAGAIVPILTCIVFFVSGEYRHPAFSALAALGGFGVDRGWLAVSRFILRRAPFVGQRGAVFSMALACAYLPVREIGPARDRKAYAEALATRSSDGTLPTSERYAKALTLLRQHTEGLEDEVLSAEATLLVLSNQAIQFRDRDAAKRLMETSRALWQRELAPEKTLEFGLDAATVSRIRRNQVRRVAQLARQPFVHDWPDIERNSSLLGGYSWREVEALLASGRLDQAEAFIAEALTWAPHAVPLLAYKGQLAARRGQDPMAWFERSLEGYPKLALPALLLSRHLLGQELPDAAIAVLQAATHERTYDETVRYTLGELMSVHETGEQMLAFFSAASSRDEKPQTSHYFVALAHHKLDNAPAAIAALERALAVDPAHEMSQRLWGLILERQGQLVPALEHLVEATRIHPEFRAALEDVARLAERLGHSAEAARWRGRAQRADTNTPRRFVYWAAYLHARGREVAALRELDRRLMDAPGDREALTLRRAILSAAPNLGGGNAAVSGSAASTSAGSDLSLGPEQH